jgi:Ca2+-binding EF-hand superfamily protein
VFEEMDPNGDGNVSADELRRYVKEEYKYDIEDEKLDAMIATADKSGDGTISYKEFLAEWESQ